MKKIILVPHTHWDREWYFTESTSSILLSRMKNDILKNNFKFAFNLDGQASLAEDLTNSKDLEKFLNENKITAGPLYIQQDMFNVTIGTTLKNITIGKKVLGECVPKTVYMPDTFGFNEQLPQIFKHFGFEGFIFWRGIKPEEKIKSNIAMWKGFDGTEIPVSILSEGYYCMGQNYPYNQEKDYSHFLTKTIEYTKRQEEKREQNIYLIPLGGDQAPYEFDITSAVKYFNSNQDKFEMIVGTYDDYFKEVSKEDAPILKGKLDNSGTSKIHRTIHSNRYDMKKSFRELELRSHFTMEALESIFKASGGSPISVEEKDENIYKPLLKSSAHDSLGGCNLDSTNQLIKSRTDKALSYTNSYIDMMKRDLREGINLGADEYLVINASPFKRDVFVNDVISTSDKLHISSLGGEILEYKQEDISWDAHDDVINHHISVFVEEMFPFSTKVIKIVKSQDDKKEKLSESVIPFSIKVEKDLGDEFDFSPSTEEPKYFNNFNLISQVSSNNHGVNQYELKELDVTLFEFKNKLEKRYKFVVNNKSKNIRMSLSFSKKDTLKLSRHLAFIEQKAETIDNWKEKGYIDNPLNFYSQDGLIINGVDNILTRGNNEVQILNNEFEVTLFRSVNFLGKPNLESRPGSASGLPFKCETTDSLMLGVIEFDFAINQMDSVAALNNWNFDGIGTFGGDVNPILNKVNRFVWNKNKLEISKNDNGINISEKLLGTFKLNEEIGICYTKPNEKNSKGRIYYEKNNF